VPGNYNLGTAEGTIKINYDGKGAKQAQEDFNKVEKSAKKSSTSLSEVSNKSLAAGGVLAAGLAYATNKAIDFEKEISNIGAVSGASKVQLDQLRAKALQLGADTSFSASQAAQAMEELAKAGVSTTDILNGAADATVALAAAGGVDLPEAATIAANSMNQFGITAKELPKVVDQIAGAANNSAIDVKDFGFSIAQVGAVAHLAGLSFQDTAVAITAMGNAGIKGSDAGTSLKSFLTNLIPTTKQQIALSQQLGLITKDGSNAFFDQTGKLKSLADIAQVLQTALKGMSKEQQLATLNTLYGSDAIRAASVIAGQGAQGVNDLATALNKTSAADVAAARLDNTAGKIEQLKGSMETAAIQIGTLLLPGVLNLTKALTSLTNWFTQLSPATQKNIVTIIQIAAAILLFVGIAGKLIVFINSVKVAWIALNASFLFSPIGLIIIAIIALVAVFVILWVKFAWFRNFWIGTWNVIWGALKAIGSWFAGPFKDFFVNTWNAVWGFFKAVGAWFAGPFANFFKALWNVLSSVFQGIWAVIKFVWDGIAASAMASWKIVKAVFDFFAPAIRATFGLIVDIIKTAWSIITAIFQVSVAVWSAIFHEIADNIMLIWNFLWNAVATSIQVVWGLIGPYVIGAWNLISNAIVSTLQFLWNSWNTIWNAVKNVAIAVWGFVGPYIMAAISGLQAFWHGALDFFINSWNTTWNLIKNVASAVWDSIVGVFRAGVQFVTDRINSIRALLGKVREFFDGMREAAKGGVGSLISYVGEIPGKVAGALAGLASRMYNAGINMIQSLIDGIKNMAGRVYDAVSGIVDKVRNLLPFSPAKEGPLSGKGYTLYSGQALVEGFAEGIRQRASQAVQAAMQMVAQVHATTDLTAPLTASYAYNGAPSVVASSPRVSVTPNFTVYAVLGDEVKKVTRTTIAEEPGLVAGAANDGNQKRNFLAPGRAM